MNKSEKSSFGKLLVLALIVLGIYFSMGVEPVEKKRVDTSFENFKNSEAVSFDLDLNIEEAREGFYDLQMDGYMEPKQESGAGEFIVDTRIEGALQTLSGQFVYQKPYLYLNFAEDGLPITLESLFREEYDLNIEEVRNEWLRMEIVFPGFDFGEEVELISENEEVGEREVYHYSIDLMTDYFTDNLRVEIFTDKSQLNIRRAIVEGESSFEKELSFPEPFATFSTDSSPKINFLINFDRFEEREEIESPDEFIEL